MILSLLEGPYRKKHIKSCCFLMIWNLPPDVANQPDQVSFATVRDLPSTRAGGQDDVSSKQTPSKYYIILYSPRALPELLQTLPKLTQALPEPLLGRAWARGRFGWVQGSPKSPFAKKNTF